MFKITSIPTKIYPKAASSAILMRVPFGEAEPAKMVKGRHTEPYDRQRQAQPAQQPPTAVIGGPTTGRHPGSVPPPVKWNGGMGRGSGWERSVLGSGGGMGCAIARVSHPISPPKDNPRDVRDEMALPLPFQNRWDRSHPGASFRSLPKRFCGFRDDVVGEAAEHLHLGS